jgi:hypothetical protein
MPLHLLPAASLIHLAVYKMSFAQLEDWLAGDTLRMSVLEAVKDLSLPDAVVAAGFIRNLVWDKLHNLPMTPLNDVDVIYFDPECIHNASEKEAILKTTNPALNWEVKNQAIMHLRNGDAPYQSSEDAMRYWPEKETAIGVRLSQDNRFDWVAPFGIESLFQQHITHNPVRSKAVFLARVQGKNWLQQWPNLSVIQT